MNIISDLIGSFDPSHPNFRPTEIFNECWLIKLVLHHTFSIKDVSSPISFDESSTWYSEALLPTAFKARYRGDRLSESRTNADGVIGHIIIGDHNKADLVLAPDASQFIVVEAKLSAPLSPGVKNAPDYDQAARNVACMAETITQSGLAPSAFRNLGFIVLAPQASINKGTFRELISKTSIEEKVTNRCAAYEGLFDTWYEKAFLPTLERIDIQELSWESVLQDLYESKPFLQESFQDFYHQCLQFN